MWCEPRSVMLVHGEAEKMKFLKTKIKVRYEYFRVPLQAILAQSRVLHGDHSTPHSPFFFENKGGGGAEVSCIG